MSYLSTKKNNLKTFFCSNCDELMKKGAFSIIKESKELKLLCQKCCSELTIEEQNKLKTKESHQEISECLEVIEDTIRFTRNPQPIFKRKQQQQQQQQFVCEICEIENKQEKNKAEVYCSNDKMKFCIECYKQNHQAITTIKHISKSIEQWMNEDYPNENKEEEKGKYFCYKHKSNEPIFCVDDSIMFCSGCYLNEHTKHQMESIEIRSKEEKKRINIDQYLESLQESKKEFVEIEEQLKSMIEVFKQQIQECDQIVNEIQETTVSLRESVEHWAQMENEVDDKEWCKREFVERVKSQVESVEQKFKEREREMRKRTREIVERIDCKTNEILDDFLSQIERDEREKTKEIKEKERRERFEKEMIEEQKKDREREDKQKNEQQRIEKKQKKKQMNERIYDSLSKIEKQVESLERESISSNLKGNSLLLNKIEKQVESLEREIISNNLRGNSLLLNKIEKQVESLEKDRLEKEIWKGSSIIGFDSKKSKFLNDCLKESGFKLDINNKPKKLFIGTVDGFSSQSFHNKCDKQGKTVVLVQTTTAQTFGGFSNVEWDSSSLDKSNSERKSFLFSLDDLEKYSLRKNNKREIYCHSSIGPSFGYGCNLYLSDNCNSSNSSYTSTHPDNSYSIGKNSRLLTEGKDDGSRNYFKVSEYEVWRIK